MIRLWTHVHADGGPDVLPQNPGHGITKVYLQQMVSWILTM